MIKRIRLVLQSERMRHHVISDHRSSRATIYLTLPIPPTHFDLDTVLLQRYLPPKQRQCYVSFCNERPTCSRLG